jgi:ACS family hexuronate transporter-like MFS transporter
MLSTETGIQHATTKQRIRWLVIAVVFAATVLNYLDRQSLSVLAPALQERLSMTAIAYGRVVAAFMLAYTITNGLWGRVIDRLGTKLGYLLSVLSWSFAEILHVFARSALGLGVCRLLLGAGEAGNWPAAVKVVAEWFPAEERALAAGIFNSGAAIGAVLAPPLIVWTASHYGWRAPFALVGAVGFLWSAAWGIFYRKPAAQCCQIAPASAVPVRVLLGSRFMWQFTVAKIFFDPVWYFYIFWFPEYLKVVRGFDLAHIGATAWIPFLVADIGNVAGGLVGGWILRRSATPQAGRKRAILLFLVLMTAGIPAVLDRNAGHLFVFASIAVFGYTGAQANLLALPADVFTADSVASVWGFASMGAGFGGMLFSLITGWIVNRWSFTPAFILFGTIPLLAGALLWLLPVQGLSAAGANRS